MESSATLNSKSPSFFWRICAPGIGLFIAWLFVCIIAGEKTKLAGLEQYAMAISVATGAAFMVAICFMYRMLIQATPLAWRIEKNDWLVGTAWVVAIYLGTFTINQVLGIPREGLMETLFDDQTAFGAAALFMAIIIAAPIGEELALRYFLLGAFIFKPTRIWKSSAIVLTASIFMLLHVPQYDYLTTHLTMLAVGVLMGYMRIRSGGLLLPMILHAEAGAVALLLNNFY